jgi:nitrate/TMAO reductase-like tetraheme cytochrome c subunit
VAASRPERPFRHVPLWLAIAVPVLILSVILLAVGTVGFVEYSSQPGFCKSCHIMRPYYDSWARSSHRNVSCIECHIAPGIRAEAMTKFQAANMVVKYFTGAYSVRPWAEIADATCMRSGCHAERLIEGVVDYKGVRFDHTPHLGEQRRGMQLRCTSCHSQIVQGSHIAVTEGTCFLCHFKDRAQGNPVAGCTGCHPSPPRVTSPEGFVVDHTQYVEDHISCISCHTQVTSGSGAADQSRCVSCHNEPARLAQFNNPPLLHRVHVTDHNIACVQCHVPIEHRVVALTTTVELDCRSCHRNVHVAEQSLYAGVGGHAAAPAPSSMFLARVSCVGCHAEVATIKGHEQANLADEASCLSCHGIRYANILPAWEHDMATKTRQVDALVEGAESALRALPLRRRTAPDSLVGLARENVSLVQVGKSAHNIVYADRLLRASVALVGEAVHRGLPYAMPAVELGPPVGANACLTCHTGVERQQGTFQGVTFDHTAHVERAGMECSQCHTPLAQHGGITLSSPASCDACHHPVIAVQSCARCHTGPGGAPEETVSLSTGDFSHRVHVAANLACAACHTPPLMSARDLSCDNCHLEHHQPDLACLDCHRGGALALHKRQDHVACVQCHATVPAINHWTRSVCTSCHATRVNHFAGRACDVCHKVPPMGTTQGTVPVRAALVGSQGEGYGGP